MSENNPSAGRVDITNGTDVRIALIITNNVEALQDRFDRAPYITQTHEPGETWVHLNVGPRWTDPEATRYCANDTYWFVTPKDPDFIPTGAFDNDRIWTADDVIVVDTLESPCFDENDEYLIEAN